MQPSKAPFGIKAGLFFLKRGESYSTSWFFGILVPNTFLGFQIFMHFKMCCAKLHCCFFIWSIHFKPCISPALFCLVLFCYLEQFVTLIFLSFWVSMCLLGLDSGLLGCCLPSLQNSTFGLSKYIAT